MTNQIIFPCAQLIYKGSPWVVTAFNSYVSCIERNGVEKVVKFDELTPIPIDSVFLKNNGAELIKNSGNLHHLKIKGVSISFKLSLSDTVTYVDFINYNYSKYGSMASGNDIKYVHQLQAILLIMTGTNITFTI